MEGTSKTQRDKNKIYGKKGVYSILGKIGEGTFSEVLKVQNDRDASLWACKRMKQRFDKVEDIQRIREIQAIRRLRKHPNVIQLAEIIFDKGSRTLFLLCELMDMNVYELIKDRTHYLNDDKVKHYMYQLLQAIYHMHKNGIFHRDIKPENILIRGDLLKVADFGSCRSISSKQPLTEYISTRWYRAPECLLTDGYYTYKMDVWSAGCVYYEILTLRPLFPGSNELDQIAKIHDVMGTPDPSVISKLQGKIANLDFNFPKVSGKGIVRHLSHVSRETVDLIERMCAYDPEVRLTSKQALEHHHFDDYRKKLTSDRGGANVGDKKQRRSARTASPPAGKDAASKSNNSNNAGVAAAPTADPKPGAADVVYLKRQKKKRRAPVGGAAGKAPPIEDAGGGDAGGGVGAQSGFLILPKMTSHHGFVDHAHQKPPNHHHPPNGLTVFHPSAAAAAAAAKSAHHNHHSRHHVNGSHLPPPQASGSAAAAAAAGAGGGAKGLITLPEISRHPHHHHHHHNPHHHHHHHHSGKNLAGTTTTTTTATALAATNAGGAGDGKHEVGAYQLPSINRQ